MNENNNFNQGNLDFEKMNETLANPEFANWYYHQIVGNTDNNMSIEEFVKTIQEYNQNKFE